ncbi:uncharacterized protein LOC119328775 [Triticum dicoccoides]|uniref:uncharacterized protein LOC119328775 n=1 Tax=Triticum dicoccoides TaxID=85692 RepID=UPI001891D5A1|nr:uncharacterized protein LOC119328775 [Triticum dicoccoides]
MRDVTYYVRAARRQLLSWPPRAPDAAKGVRSSSARGHSPRTYACGSVSLPIQARPTEANPSVAVTTAARYSKDKGTRTSIPFYHLIPHFDFATRRRPQLPANLPGEPSALSLSVDRMVPMVTEAWTLAGCGGAASKPLPAQEVPTLLHPTAKKPTSFRAVAVASSTSQDGPGRRDAAVVGRRGGIASCLLAALALAGSSSSGGAARAAILEADDDLELLERVKEDKKKRLQKQGIINSSAAETGYLQDLVYKLSKVGQAIDKDDLAAAGDVLGPASDAPWVQNVNAAFSKFSSSSEEKSAVDTFNSSLSSLFTSVSKSDINSSKSAFVSSATALEKWVELAGLTGKLKGF